MNSTTEIQQQKQPGEVCFTLNTMWPPLNLSDDVKAVISVVVQSLDTKYGYCLSLFSNTPFFFLSLFPFREKLKYCYVVFHMEPQTKNHHEEDAEVALCAAIECVGVKSLTKDENLRTILHNLLNSLKTVHGNKIYVCKGRDNIIIRGLYFTSDRIDLCENVCLHVIKSEDGNVESPLEYCQRTCEKFVIPYAQATLIENYNKLIYTLARNNVKFGARLADTVFEIVIKT